MKPLVALTICAVLAGACPAQAKIFTVDTTVDDAGLTACDDATPNDCSLRGAISAANALPGADTVTVPAGTYTLTIPSTDFEGSNANGDLDVTDDLTLSGAGAATTIIQACAPVSPATTCTGINRVLDVDPSERFPSKGITAAISGVTIRNGHMDAYADHSGAGIRNHATFLTISDSIVTGNSATAHGGGISQEGGTLTVLNSTVSGNTAAQFGGGIVVGDGAVLTVSDSTISGNVAHDGGGMWTGFFDISGKPTIVVTRSSIEDNVATAGNGGGIERNRGTLTITDSTLSGNFALGSEGGGIYSSGDGYGGSGITIRNSTFTGNQAASGGGIEDAGASLSLLNCTIAGNTAHGIVNAHNATGGGIEGGAVGGFAGTVANTIIAGNVSDFSQNPDCSGTVTSAGYNLIQSTQGCGITGDLTGNVTGKDAKLGALGDNGGPTETRALLASSPAIDAGNPAAPGSGTNACRPADQRGVLRPKGSACDIGAFEFEGGFTISGSAPSHGGTGAPLVTFVYGSGFADDATVKLTRSGESDIVGSPVAVGEEGSVIATTFDLTGATTGAWDLVVTNPDQSSASRPFTIEEPRPQVWVDVLGNATLRLGQPGRYTILFGNRGNADALAVPLALAVPSDFILSLLFPVTAPPAELGQVPTDWTQVPVDVQPGGAGDFATVPLVLPLVPTGFAGALQLTLTAPVGTHGQSFEIRVPVDPPYFQPQLDSQVVADLVAGARGYAQRVLLVDVSDTLVPALTQYATKQLEDVVALGRTALVTDLATRPQVYSLAQLVIDLAEFGAVQQGAAATPLAPRLTAIARAIVSSLLYPDAAQALGGGGSRAECSDMGWKVVSTKGGAICVPPKCAAQKDPTKCGNGFPILGGGSVDPNDKFGAVGAGAAHFVSGEEPLRYQVVFENLASATAAAREVVVTDPLDTTNLDLSTFSLGPIAFGDHQIFPPPGLSAFVTDVDLRPAQNLLVRIQAGLDADTGVVTWHFLTLDPDTQSPPADPLVGFLPPNASPPEGEGSVVYTVKAKAGLATGTEIQNQATVVFDTNAPIDTPQWLNTLDDAAPESQVAALDPVQCLQILVEWAGSDVGSGIARYTIFVSEDGGAFSPWLVDTEDTSATFAGQLGKTYAFYSVATDATGNVEDAPATPDTVTTATDCGSNDLAVTKITAPKVIGLSGKKPVQTKQVKVEIQNRSPHAETIPDAAVLGNLVSLALDSVGACAAPVPVFVAGKPQKIPPITLKTKQKLAVLFDVTFSCANDPLKSTTKSPGHADYSLHARVKHGALGSGDADPADDICPRQVTPPGVVDPFPNGKLLDKGCGAKKADKTFGAPIVVDVTVKP
ncbi:MAG: right-handed parallel beta-helix repeat-containing protein [Deltaproteobacteria bacterium]|nr:right-handed parallel beta-helix repeat-containing protein [Deltaproteobacteria bacterium]